MRFSVLICLMALSAIAETRISGSIGGITFDEPGNPYIISEDLIVDEGKKTVIKAGCVFLFNNFSGIKINGGLIVDGTAEKPVLFTSVNDSTFSNQATQPPAPFDWNGITISSRASQIKMSNFILAYSVYGIKSEKEAITVEKGTFRENGQFDITINNEILPVSVSIPYSYSKILTDDTPGKTDSNKIIPLLPAAISEPQQKSNKIVAPVLVGSAGICSGVAGGILAVKFTSTREAYSVERDAAERSKLKSKGIKQLAASAVCSGLGVAALTSSVVMLLRNATNKNNNSSISLQPTFGLSLTGATVLIDF